MSNIELPGEKHLTPLEVQALRLRLEGMSSQEAADVLGLQQKTVYWHMMKVHKKLGTHNVLQARHRLQELGLLESVMRKTDMP